MAPTGEKKNSSKSTFKLFGSVSPIKKNTARKSFPRRNLPTVTVALSDCRSASSSGKVSRNTARKSFARCESTASSAIPFCSSMSKKSTKSVAFTDAKSKSSAYPEQGHSKTKSSICKVTVPSMSKKSTKSAAFADKKSESSASSAHAQLYKTKSSISKVMVPSSSKESTKSVTFADAKSGSSASPSHAYSKTESSFSEDPSSSN